jgi:hypothetical protein
MDCESFNEGFEKFENMLKSLNKNIETLKIIQNYGKLVEKNDNKYGFLDTHNRLFLNHSLNKLEIEINQLSI